MCRSLVSRVGPAIVYVILAWVLSSGPAVRAQSATIPGSTGINSDIGKEINNLIPPKGNAGTINIPDGRYIFTTPIVIKQGPAQFLTIHCSSRNAILDYRGSGNAIFIAAYQYPTSQVTIENCSLYGNNAAAGTDGIHLSDVQNFRLQNAYIDGFKGINLHGVGVVGSVITATDLENGGKWNLVWEPDTKNLFGSTSNRVFGGSMHYGGTGNYWDKGNRSVYGGNTEDILEGVTLEEGTSVAAQAIVEGTWNAAIRDSYIEFLPFGSSTSSIFNVMVGNTAGTGIGTSTDNPSSNFVFENNYMITPLAGSGYTTASMFITYSDGAEIANVVDNGMPTFGITWGKYNGNATTRNLQIGWRKSLYQNPPTSSQLWQHPDMPMGLGQWQMRYGGLHEWIGSMTLGASGSAYTVRQNVPVSGSPLCSADANSICTFHVTLPSPMPDANWHMTCQASASNTPGVITSVSPPVNNSEAVVTFRDLSGLANKLTSVNCEAWE